MGRFAANKNTFSIFPVKLHTAAPVIAMLTVQIYSGGDARSQPLAAQAQWPPQGRGMMESKQLIINTMITQAATTQADKP